MRTRQNKLVVIVALSALMLSASLNSLSAAPRSPVSPAAGTVFFSDDFEAPSLGSSWLPPAHTDNGLFELSAKYAHSGAQSVFLGQKVAGGASASLELALDLSAQSNQKDVFLDFWARAIGSYDYRTVSISDDGGTTWKQILDLSEASQSFSHQVLDIASVATAEGLTLNNQFRILFYYGKYIGQINDGFIIDDVRLTQRAQEIAAFPLTQDTFEATTFQQGLYPQSTAGGVAEINPTYAHSGAQSAFLGQKVIGNASASLVLALDLTGQTDVFLDFWARAIGSYDYRTVSISNDGGTTWKQILDLSDASQSFSHQVLDIASAAAAKGLTLNNQFRILFYYGKYIGQTNDGFIIDDVRLTQHTQAIGSFPFGPETFESGDVQQGLYPQSTDGGVAEINTTYAHSGVRSAFLGQKVAGNASASLVLALDLTGQTDVLLDFWARATGSYDYRTVSISDDGGTTWKQILDLSEASQSFSHQSLNIASAAAAKGLSLNNQFRILFYYGKYIGQTNDGFIIDDLKLVRTSLSGKVYNEAATAGNEVAGAFVEICSASNACQTIATDSDGSYAFGDLASGDYTLRALPQAGNNHLIGKLGPVPVSADTPLANQNMLLPKPTSLPVGTSVTPAIGLVDGVPSIFWQTPVLLTQKGCANGTASYQIYVDGKGVRNGNLAEEPAGMYSTQLAPLFPLHGVIQVQVNVQCASGPQVNVTFNIWIDPSGVVVNTQGKPIIDATVSLYGADAAAGPFNLVVSGSGVMSPANRVNPMETDSNGAFGWDVVAGYYRVRAEKAGCTAPGSSQAYNETAVLTIPPPVTDLRIVLFCGEARQAQVFLPLVRK